MWFYCQPLISKLAEKSDANTALMSIILVIFEMCGRFLMWRFIHLYKVQRTLTREQYLLTGRLFPCWKRHVQRAAPSTDSLRCEHLGALWHLFSNSLSSTFIYFFLFLLASSHERDPTRDISTQRRRSELRAQGPGPPSDKCTAWKLAHNSLLRFRMSSLPSHVAKDGPMQLRVYGSHSRKCHLNLFSSLLFF